MDTTRMVSISIIIMEFAPLSAQEKGAQAVCAEAVISSGGCEKRLHGRFPFLSESPVFIWA